MKNEDYMKLAIKGAKEAVKKGKPPICSIMVKDEKIIARGWSSVGNEFDPSGHNDINCIKASCKALKTTLDLSGCVMYTTIEPCSMCLGCAAWAGLPKIVFGAYQEDISDNPYELKDYHAKELAKNMVLANGRKMEVVGGILKEECKQLMRNFKNWMPLK